MIRVPADATLETPQEAPAAPSTVPDDAPAVLVLADGTVLRGLACGAR